MQLPLKIRFGAAYDLDFIYNSWIKSYRNRVPVCKTLYCKKQHDLITSILGRSTILVATPDTDPELIVGYLVYEAESTLHWVYVKQSFRHMGIAQELLKYAGLTDDFEYSHLAPSFFSRWLMLRGGEYNPYVLMEDHHARD